MSTVASALAAALTAQIEADAKLADALKTMTREFRLVLVLRRLERAGLVEIGGAA